MTHDQSPPGTHPSVRAAYDRWAVTYDADRNLTRDLDAAATRQILAGFGGETVLEIGCGTGKNTPFLAQLGRRVLALDFSPGMIAQARARLSASGVDDVSFILADLTRPWPCATGWADLIICNLVLEHIAGLAPVFAEAHRTLSARGRLFICELHPFRQYLGARATFQQGEARVEITATVHHVSDFLDAAERNGFALQELREWWHEEDANEPPRLVSLLFAK